MIDLSTYGRPINLSGPIIARVAVEDTDSPNSESVLVCTQQPAKWNTKYRAVLTSAYVSQSNIPAQFPVVHSAKQVSHLKAGDIVVMQPRSGHVRTLFRRDSEHNALLVTERCNSFCLMCSQPPIDRDDSELVDINLQAIRLMEPAPARLGITGGEPTLLGNDLFRIFDLLRSKLPTTDVHMLTNGRRFAWRDFTEAFVDARPSKLMLGIPLYSNTASEHDYVVQARGAFDETLQGLHQLARYDVPIEIRVVVHALTVPHLHDIAEYIYRNTPFASHITFMGLEITGFTKPNLKELWIDPYDYQRELTEAVEHLAVRGMNVSIYNHQLCVIPRQLWHFTRKSISDWKNLYLDECGRCSERSQCGGLFKSAEHQHSQHIHSL